MANLGMSNPVIALAVSAGIVLAGTSNAGVLFSYGNGDIGQRVAVLQEGEQEAGHHELTFLGNGLASGRCYCKMTARTYVAARGMLFIRHVIHDHLSKGAQ